MVPSQGQALELVGEPRLFDAGAEARGFLLVEHLDVQNLLQVGREHNDAFDAVPKAHAAGDESDAFLAGGDALVDGAAGDDGRPEGGIDGLLVGLGRGAGDVELERAAEDAVLVAGGVLGEQALRGVVDDGNARAEHEADGRHERKDIGRRFLVHALASGFLGAWKRLIQRSREGASTLPSRMAKATPPANTAL